MLYSSTDKRVNNGATVDANSYPAFKVVDSTVVKRITDEMDSLGDPEEERELPSRSTPTTDPNTFPVPCALVGALTKALCCTCQPPHLFPPLIVPQTSIGSHTPPLPARLPPTSP